MSDQLQFTEKEKEILRDVAVRNVQAQAALQSAQNEAFRRRAYFEQAVEVIVRMKGLDSTKIQLSFDIEADRWELLEIKPKDDAPDPEVLKQALEQVQRAQANGAAEPAVEELTS